MAPVVRRAQDGERELVELSWGFVLPQPSRRFIRKGNLPATRPKARDDIYYLFNDLLLWTNRSSTS